MGEEVIILPALFGAVVWLVYIVVDGFRRRQRLRVFTEFHSKMLDRIGSAKEFGEFFGSDAGNRFLESLASEKGAPQTRILAALQWGLTLSVLGIALFILLGSRSGVNQFRADTVDVLLFVATVAVGVGAGTLISSFAAYLMSRQMGLMGKREGDVK
jgi:hypothetical protein